MEDECDGEQPEPGIPKWKETDAQARQMEQTQFFKDIALAGAALMGLPRVWLTRGVWWVQAASTTG